MWGIRARLACVALVSACVGLVANPSGGAGMRSSVRGQPTASEATLDGQVLGAQGAPLSGVRLRMLRISARGDVALFGKTVTGPGGAFTIGLPPEGGLLVARMQGYRPALRWISPSRGRSLRLRLTRFVAPGSSPVPRQAGTEVSGRVTSAAGEPVANATIRVLRLDMRTWRVAPLALRTDAGEQYSVSTDRNGRFHFSLEEPIEVPQFDAAGFEVVCEAPGYATRALPVQPRPTQEMEIRLDEAAASVAGSVRTPDGSPARGTPVTVFAVAEGAPFVEMVRTDAKGLFRTKDHVPLAPTYVALVNEPDYQPVARQVAWEDRGSVSLQLNPGADLAVDVVDASTGAVIPDARVLASVTVGPFTVGREGERTASGFVVRNLPPDEEVTVTVSAPTYLKGRTRVQVQGGSQGGSYVRIELEPAGSIVGRVTDDAGRAVPAVRVVAIAADSTARSASAFTGDDGSFRIDGLTRDASYTVSCTARGFAPWWRDGLVATRPAASLDIRLDRGAMVSGHVLHEDGTPAKGVIVRAVRVTPDPADPDQLIATPVAQKEVRTASDGSYLFPSLAEGSYLIAPVPESLPKVGHWEREDPAPPLPLHSGDVLDDLDFFLASPGTLRISLDDARQVADQEQEPRVTFITRVGDHPFYGDRVTVRAARDEAGVYHVDDIAEGVYDVEVRFDGFEPVRRKAIEIRGGDETMLEVGELSRGATLRLHVVDQLGADVPGLVVRLFRVTRNDIDPDHRPVLARVPKDNPSLVTVQTDGTGRAVIEGLEAGTYQLHITEGLERTYQGPYYYEEFKVERKGEHEDSEDVIEKTVVFDRGGPVTFVLLDAQGVPLGGASLNLTRIEQDFAGIHVAGVADANGECTLENVMPGLYSAEVFAVAAAQEGRVRQPYYETTIAVRGDGPIEIRVP